MNHKSEKYRVDARDAKGTIIGDGTRIDSLTIHEARTLSEEAIGYATTGIALLKNRSYGDAERAFEQSIERAPGGSFLHYRLALARLGGRSPTDLSTARIRSVEEALRQSLALGPEDGRPALLLAYVRYDHYLRHCRRFQGRGPEELFRLAQRQGLTDGLIADLRRHARVDTLLRKLRR